MFADLDVFVFTLGLTEAWRAKSDGAVFPLAPGVAGGVFNPDIYEFVNFGVAETVQDLKGFVARLARVNPRARVILTVSPVPLIATYEARHVLVSTTYSKSVLRVAAEEVARSSTNVTYFPSYEIVTGNYNRGRYFESDLRSVTRAGVEHVMRMFFRHFARDVAIAEAVRQTMDIVCEEERLAAPDSRGAHRARIPVSPPESKPVPAYAGIWPAIWRRLNSAFATIGSRDPADEMRGEAVPTAPVAVTAKSHQSNATLPP
jgi:hypothetical protein